MLEPYTPWEKPSARLPILCEAQNWRCCYCGFRVRRDDTDKDKWDAPSREHVMPLRHGGIMVWENEVMACRLCNTGRARMRPETYLAKVIELGRWRAYKWAMKMRKNGRRNGAHGQR